MESASSPQPIQTNWKALYLAAIQDTNSRTGSEKLADAERAILDREREIFYSQVTPEEEEALEDALYALRALKTAWQYCTAA